MLSAALDCRESSIFFSLLENETEIFNLQKDNSPRDSSFILKWLAESLEKKKFDLDDISEWTIGAGPSSFTNLRVLSSLLSGIVFRNPNCKGRGVPCACAIAAQFAQENNLIKDRITVLFPSPDKGIFYHSVNAAPDFSPEDCGFMTDPRRICEIRNPICAMQNDKEALLQFISASHADIAAPYFIEKYPVAKLAKVMPNKFASESLANLIYLRPPA